MFKLSSNLFQVVLLVLATLAPGVALAQDIRSVEVKFPRGSSGTTINETITGAASIDYRVGVSAGQRMSVQLDTSNASNYFNIIAPGASEALFIGSSSGNSTSFVIPSSGNYTIRVYLMRNAARRNETANFALNIYVENAAAITTRPAPSVSPPANPAPTALSTDLMPRFCAGEASAEFSVRPQDLTTNLAFKSGNSYVVQGYFDANGSTTFFNCYFALDGSFRSVN